VSATLTGTIVKADGSAARGKVRITPNFTHSINVTTNVVAVAETLVIQLNAIGAFLVTLQGTDDPAYDPVNFTYTISFDLLGMDIDTFSFSLPNGTTLDLADIAPVPSRSGDLTGRVYVQSTQPTSPNVDDIWIKI
jgi:hypothetical protein